jgi:hypothetical protein
MESASKIPILPVAQTIFDKYENNPQCLNEDKLLLLKPND